MRKMISVTIDGIDKFRATDEVRVTLQNYNNVRGGWI